MAIKARSRALGPFHPSFDVNRIIYESLVKTLPDDAHLKANGRLNISVTRISDGKNVIINKFKSKEELIKVSHMPLAGAFPDQSAFTDCGRDQLFCHPSVPVL